MRTCEVWKQMKESNKLVIDNFLLSVVVKTNGTIHLWMSPLYFLLFLPPGFIFFPQKQSTNCSTQSTSAIAQPKKDKGVVFLGFYSRVTVEQLEQLEL